MTKSGDGFHVLLAELHQLLDDTKSSPHFSEFSDVSEVMMQSYTRLVSEGLPGQTIALAMLGATLNLYDIFGLKPELPQLLRALADKVESDARIN